MEISQHIPLEINQFIGREPEIVHVTRLLATTRVLTLTGAAGCGKTRLALQIAGRYASAFADGVYWCDLAALSDPAFVPQTVAGVLGCAEQPTRSVLEAMIGCVGTRQLLIVLDNCEHVLGPCAALTSSLIAACPRVTILATSLQSLGVSEEQTWTVPPLQCPTPEEHPIPSSGDGRATAGRRQ